jgi:cell division septation protein DedD
MKNASNEALSAENGAASVAAQPAGAVTKQPTPKQARKTAKPTTSGDKRTYKTNPQTSATAKNTKPKPPTKRKRLLRLISRKSGARLEDLMEQLGWQAHTVRSAISRLKPEDGTVVSDKDGKGRLRYRLTSEADVTPSSESRT